MIPDKTNRLCHLKWSEFSWNLASNNVTACCDATPATIDIPAAKLDPSSVFNGRLARERQALKRGEEVPSCESCWKKERIGLISKRLRNIEPTDYSQHEIASPKTLVINLHSVCPLQCVYCCHEYSSTWYTDSKKNGPILEDVRYTPSAKDKLRHSLSQSDLSQTISYRLFDSMLRDGTLDAVEKMRISGGEPLHLPDLLLQLLDLAWQANPSMHIGINTGLSLSKDKLIKLLDRLEPYRSHMTFYLSMETTGRSAEIIRNGIVWTDWTDNVELMRERGFDIAFHSVLNVLSIFGFEDFLRYADSLSLLDRIHYEWLTDPSFLDLTNFSQVITEDAIASLLDSDLISSNLRTDLTSICPAQDDQQVADFIVFMNGFASRKKIGTDDLPVPIANLL